jgi:hypothetical protein
LFNPGKHLYLKCAWMMHLTFFMTYIVVHQKVQSMSVITLENAQSFLNKKTDSEHFLTEKLNNCLTINLKNYVTIILVYDVTYYDVLWRQCDSLTACVFIVSIGHRLRNAFWVLKYAACMACRQGCHSRGIQRTKTFKKNLIVRTKTFIHRRIKNHK